MEFIQYFFDWFFGSAKVECFNVHWIPFASSSRPPAPSLLLSLFVEDAAEDGYFCSSSKFGNFLSTYWWQHRYLRWFIYVKKISRQIPFCRVFVRSSHLMDVVAFFSCSMIYLVFSSLAFDWTSYHYYHRIKIERSTLKFFKGWCFEGNKEREKICTEIDSFFRFKGGNFLFQYNKVWNFDADFEDFPIIFAHTRKNAKKLAPLLTSLSSVMRVSISLVKNENVASSYIHEKHTSYKVRVKSKPE